jgi:hypothetical protein
MGVPQFVTSSKLIKTLMMEYTNMHSIMKVFVNLLLVTNCGTLWIVDLYTKLKNMLTGGNCNRDY